MGFIEMVKGLIGGAGVTDMIESAGVTDMIESAGVEEHVGTVAEAVQQPLEDFGSQL